MRLRILKKAFWVLSVVVILAVGSYRAYFMIMPEVLVSNTSGTSINSVTVQLPNNRIVFGVIAPNVSRTIFYSLNQADGTYKYSIVFETGEIISDECGYVTDYEIGKVFHINIKSVNEIECGGNEV